MNTPLKPKHVQHLGLHQFPYRSVYRSNLDYKQDVFHSHQGLELYYVHEGSGILICDGYQLQLSPGMLVVFRPFQLHRMRFHIDGCVRSFLLFEPAALQTLLPAFPTANQYLRKLLESPIPSPFLTDISENHPLIQSMRLLHEAMHEANNAWNHVLELCSSSVLAMLQWLHQLQPLKDGATRDRDRGITHIERALEWIESHLTEELRLEELSLVLHLHPNYISTLFQQEIGCSIREYVAIRRVNLARKWLLNSDMQVQEIAAKLGLANTSHFCKMFKKHSGITPYQFKKQFNTSILATNI
ncbi:AraC family transcriptional regulator [Paenibacillus qinlingensis]|uniref:AraC-like DNA-binding protein n=1 Tax=Paenibacillus qinlingensis TaxID=1837343 RepID=A0ABU1NSL6_9BACL|nr:AraC family transcriptional regulator [Paenibacillus qinlingensis]MDR6550445.1 AraC-like DNA-binding protein [Paenibacillus qinlingensis]